MSEEITITSIQPVKKMGRPKGSKNKAIVKVSAVDAPKVEKTYAISVSENHYKIIDGMSACSGIPRSTILGLIIDKFVGDIVKG